MERMIAEAQNGEYLNHKKLDQVKSLLVYLSRMYSAMNPYLKGINMTLDQWRGSRDEYGWILLE